MALWAVQVDQLLVTMAEMILFHRCNCAQGMRLLHNIYSILHLSVSRKAGLEKDRKRQLARVLLVSCLSNERTMLFVRELSANVSVWVDNIISIGRVSLIGHLCFPIQQFRIPLTSSRICGIWHKYRNRKGCENQPLITDGTPAVRLRDSFTQILC